MAMEYRIAIKAQARFPSDFFSDDSRTKIATTLSGWRAELPNESLLEPASARVVLASDPKYGIAFIEAPTILTFTHAPEPTDLANLRDRLILNLPGLEDLSIFPLMALPPDGDVVCRFCGGTGNAPGDHADWCPGHA